MDIARYIDHTCLKPEATPEEITRLCREASQYHFLTVCVNSVYVSLARECLQGTDVKPISVVGFPLGAMPSSLKAAETERALRDGAQEIDMVMWLGGLKSRRLEEVTADIKAVVDTCGKIPVKVIIETGLLTYDEKILACQITQQAGAQFVKTSTGFLGGGATVSDIQLMRQIVGPHLGVKASGGVRGVETALALIEAGANRLGTSSGVAIVTGARSKAGY